MAKKHPIGRPKMAKTERKTGFPLRLRPVLIKEIKEQAKLSHLKNGALVERIIETALNFAS